LAIGLPILATSFLAPPLVAVGIGAGAGSVFAYLGHLDLREEAGRHLGHIYGDPEALDLNSVSALKRQRDFGVVTLPLAFSGTGLLSSRLGPASRWLLKISITPFQKR